MARRPIGSRYFAPIPLGEPLPTRLKAWTPAAGNVRFSEARAIEIRRFFEGSEATLTRPGSSGGAVTHTKGQWERVPFYLDAWQWGEIIAPLFGHEVYDLELDQWVRLYTFAWLSIGRKNGKSELMAALGLYFLAACGEGGAEVYSAAGSKDQASLVFNVAARMAELSPVFRAAERDGELRVIRTTKRIIHPASDSVWRVLASDADTNLGADPFAVLFDEVAAQRNADLFDALKTGFGSRREPILIAATTAARDTNRFAKSEDELSEAVIEDPAREPRRFVFIRRADQELEWRDERAWVQANPALAGKRPFLRMEILRQEAREIEERPDKLETFEVFRLNRWGRSAGAGGIPLNVWDRSGGDLGIELEASLAGRRCYSALDLSSSQDLSSLAHVFPLGESTEVEEMDPDTGLPLTLELEKHAVIWRHWVPAATLAELDRRTGGRASRWVAEGHISATPGNVIDYATIGDELEADGERFELAELAYDRWGAVGFVSALRDRLEGLKIVPFGQGFRSMGPATLEFRRLVLAGALPHGGNPVARWEAGNVKFSRDEAGSEKPDKRKSIDKIDGIVAAIMGVGRARLNAQRKPRKAALTTFGG